jgi:hypothetical protein
MPVVFFITHPDVAIDPSAGVSRKLLHVGWRSIDAPTPDSFSSI